MFVDRHRVQPELDRVADLGVVEAEREQSPVTRDRREAETRRHAVGADGVEDGDACDGPVLVKGAARGRAAIRIDRRLVAPARGRVLAGGADAVVRPRGLERLLVGPLLDAGGADQAAERPRGVGTAREADQIKFVAALVSWRRRCRSTPARSLEADADRAAEDVLEKVGLRPNARVVENPLRHSVRGVRLISGALTFGFAGSSFAMLVSSGESSSHHVPSIRITIRFMAGPAAPRERVMARAEGGQYDHSPRRASGTWLQRLRRRGDYRRLSSSAFFAENSSSVRMFF